MLFLISKVYYVDKQCKIEIFILNNRGTDFPYIYNLVEKYKLTKFINAVYSANL